MDRVSCDVYLADVGASGGIHSRWMSGLFSTYAYLFDPFFCTEDFGKPVNQELANFAIGDVDGAGLFNVTKKRDVSSLLTPNFDLLKNFPDADRYEVIDEKRVAIRKIDSALNRAPLDFMKIDTQGTGFNVLKGAENKLNNLIGLEIEVDFIPIYKDSRLFGEVDEYLKDKDMVLMDISRVYWNRTLPSKVYSRKGELVWGDALYFKRHDTLIDIIEKDLTKLKAAIFCYMAYGYASLAIELSQHFSVDIDDLIDKCDAVFSNKWRYSDLFLGNK